MAASERLPLAGIILAAGKSQRMGANKMLLSYLGKSMLQHVIDAACASSLSPLVLVLGAEHAAIRDAVDTRTAYLVVNPVPQGLYSSSLQAGLRCLDKIDPTCAGAMFILGDQPLLRTETIEQLACSFYQEPERWVAPVYGGRRGNPVIAPRSWFPAIFRLKGDIGPREYLRDPAARLLLVAVEDEGVIFDIDTPREYQRLLSFT